MSRIGPRLVLLQSFGNLLLLAASLLWLRIPDSHVWELVLSVLLGAVIAAALLALHAFTIQRIRRPAARQRLWLGSLILLLWFAFAVFAWHLAAHLGDHVPERAGYWNSHFGPQLRTVFTYNRLISWQQDLLMVLLWIVLPALLLPWIVESVANRALPACFRSGLRVLLDWRHWVATVLVCSLLLWVTPRLVNWHPVDSVSGEIVSALLRLPLVFAIGVALVLVLLAVEAVLLARHSIGRHAAAEPSLDRL